MCTTAYAADNGAAKNAASVDVAASRREYLFSLPRWSSEIIISNLRDARDMPVAILYYNIILIALPAVILLYSAPACHAFGALYLVSLYAIFLARFLVALLHVTEHRPLFRQGESQKPALSYSLCECRQLADVCKPRSAKPCNAVTTLQATRCSIP